MTIAILGGTGPEGLGIAARLAQAGESVVIGSRSPNRAAAAAERLSARIPHARISGTTNAEAASRAEVVFVAVPYAGLDHIVETCGAAMQGKVVVDAVVPLEARDGHFDVEAVPEGSAAQRLQARLPGARVVTALKNQSAVHLQDLDHPVEGDVLVCGNDEEARRIVAELVRRIPGLRVVDAGDLRMAPLIERMTALLLNLNRRHRAHASFRITGL